MRQQAPTGPGAPRCRGGRGAQREEAFWGLVDSIYRDQGRIDDPHLWERARTLELDLEEFERERRSAALAERVRRDFEAGIRAGVTGTPGAFVDGRTVGRDVGAALEALA